MQWSRNGRDNGQYPTTTSRMIMPFVDNDTFFTNSLRMQPPPPPPILVNCGELRARHLGKYVEISGRYSKKKLDRFADIRDKYGVTQLVISAEKYPKVARRFSNLLPDSIIRIVGNVMLRPSLATNQSMPTGEIEIEVEDILSFNWPINCKGNQKRSYSTMATTNYRGITSTEYRLAQSDNIIKYFDNRKITCNDLRLSDVGKSVELLGWLTSVANSKFQYLKDGYGQTQIIVENENLDILRSIPINTVIQVKGHVVARPATNINTTLDTGEIELYIDELKVLDPRESYQGSINPNTIQNEPVLQTEQQSAELYSEPAITTTNKFTCRTHNCGELTIQNVGQNVIICGWLEFQRMKKFLVLRDGYGQIQAIIPEIISEKINIEGVPYESILKISGKVIPRPTNMRNPLMKTGDIEVMVANIEVLNEAKKNLPMEVRGFNRAKESLRMEYRYIDLRFSDMQRNLRMRSSVLMKMREYLINSAGFVEVETPTLFRRTPGGAQEFVVPTRKVGHFYSLVQSPQQFKQMLMAGAIDRYFQIARCYRDEATRPDRQPEFTQLDIELSFTNRENIMELIEEIIQHSWPQELQQIQLPFQRMTYQEAMEKYGTDKPDTRFESTLRNITDIIKTNEKLVNMKDFGAYAILFKKPQAILTTSTKKQLEAIAKDFNCKFAYSKVNKKSLEEWIQSGLTKLLSIDIVRSLVSHLNIEQDDLLFIAYGSKEQAQTLLGRIRLNFIEILENDEHIPKRSNDQYNFLWVLDFPMFTKNAETKLFESTHHPFTAPHDNDYDKLKSKCDLESIRSQAYDLVLNGQEIGGGSIRIHNRDLQLFILDEILKIDHNHLNHLLEALHSGCPPHGGIALGLDRFMSILCKTNSIRDVIAFPKGLDGKDHLSKAPVPISEEERKMYGLGVNIKADDS